MLLIGYGVAALIVIIILIAVNVRASRGSSGGKPVEPEQAVGSPGGGAQTRAVAEAESSGPQAAAEGSRARAAAEEAGGESPERMDAAAVAAPAPQAAPAAREEARTPAGAPKLQPADADRAGTKDQGFRDALRNLKGGPDRPDREPEPGARPNRQDAIISDSEYRKAMRELRRPDRGEDGR